MNKKARVAISEYNMLIVGDTLVAAVSGGADSTAMLHFLHSIADEFGIALRAVHVNHGIRGAESDRDEAFVKAFCGKLNVPLEVFKINDIFAKARLAGQGLEEYARTARYNFFQELSATHNAKIATAHTQSDSMETTLFNMVRGTGLRGLMGVPAVRGRVIRPLILCTRQDIENYCTENKLQYVTDSTNLQDDCARNRIRHYVIPAMRQVHAGCDTAYSRMVRHLAADNDFLETAALTALQNAGEPQGYSTKALLGLHSAVGYRVISLIFSKNAVYQHDTAKAELLLKHLGDEHFALQLSRGKIAEIKNGILTINNCKKQIPYFELPVKEGKFRLRNSTFVTFAIINCEQIEKYCQKGLNNALDYDRICGEFILRQKKNGDKIELNKRGITKSLKKLFYEAGLTEEQRQNTAVLADSEGVVWADGFGCAKRVAITEATKRVFTVSIEEEA